LEFKNPTPKATFAPAARGGRGCQQTRSASGQSVLLQHTESVFESRSDRTVFSLGERKGFVFVFGWVLFRALSSGFRTLDLCVRIYGLEFRVEDLRFRT